MDVTGNALGFIETRGFIGSVEAAQRQRCATGAFWCFRGCGQAKNMATRGEFSDFWAFSGPSGSIGGDISEAGGARFSAKKEPILARFDPSLRKSLDLGGLNPYNPARYGYCNTLQGDAESRIQDSRPDDVSQETGPQLRICDQVSFYTHRLREDETCAL